MKILNRYTGRVILEVAGANLYGANLAGADLAGADLAGADLRNANLEGADLTDADLVGADLRNADLHGTNLVRANLRGADLTGANFTGANLAGANLANAYLLDANLAGAKGLPSAPSIPNLDSKILAAIEAGGKLEMGEWHTCETTHCRAGWAITLAGDAGNELESKTSSYLAGLLIYKASYPDREPPDFFASNEDALADIRRSADMEGGAKSSLGGTNRNIRKPK